VGQVKGVQMSPLRAVMQPVCICACRHGTTVAQAPTSRNQIRHSSHQDGMECVIFATHLVRGFGNNREEQIAWIREQFWSS
jgi:hypothetical protein